MLNKNKTMYAILGILSIGPGSGYDIKKYCDTIISNFWNENFGHIYPVLNRMAEEGFIKTVDNNASLRKKEYEITEKGKEEFLNWLLEPVTYQPIRSEFFLKFTFSSHLPKDNILTMLQEYKERHQLKLKQYEEMEKYFEQQEKDILPEREIFLYAPLHHGVLTARATIAWCDEIIGCFKNKESD